MSVRLTLPGLPAGGVMQSSGVTGVVVDPGLPVPVQYILSSIESLTGQLVSISPANAIASSVAVS